MSHAAPAFSGFSSPNYTMVPDQLFDELLPELSGAELKTLLYIIRRTFGFKRDADAISISQLLGGIITSDGRILDRGVGLSKPALLSALRSLAAKQIIITERQRSVEKGNEPTIYRLNVDQQPKKASSPPKQPPLVKKVDQAPLVKKSDTPLVKKVAPQYTGLQNTDNSNIRKDKREQQETQEVDPYAENTIYVDSLPEKPVQPSANDHTPTQTATPIGMLVGRLQRPQTAPEQAARDTIMLRIEQFAEEFHDRATLKSSTSRAYNLYVQSGLSAERFIAHLWEARTITRERLKSQKGQPIASQMGYFFSVLMERLGLREQPAMSTTKTIYAT